MNRLLFKLFGKVKSNETYSGNSTVITIKQTLFGKLIKTTTLLMESNSEGKISSIKEIN